LISISPEEIAHQLLQRCIEGNPPAELPRTLWSDDPSGRALFGVLVEGLADRFEPALCDIYAQLFSQLVASVTPGVDPAELVARYRRVRRVRPIAADPRQVFVLSRITLGADVAVTSVMLDAAKQRFPHAEIYFVGPNKNFELFRADPRVRHVSLAYPRGSLHERLAVWDDLKRLFALDSSIVIDPDSRLTQLGLLPVCPDERYYFFESRAYRSETNCSLSQLSAAWAAETFGVPDARPWMNTGPQQPVPQIAVSLGVGENPAKRLPDPFEAQLLALLAGTGLRICIDKGAGGEEAERVVRAVERSSVAPQFWDGSFAGFASVIVGSSLYVGYDSAGQHVAAACGTPLISVFTGFPVPRMFERWKPVGDRVRVIRLDQPAATRQALARVQSALVDLGLLNSLSTR